ncbi:ATP-dependent DNA helicase [Canna indica]|uniref:DNA 3'-5' helicase n=1 Tax=Canna indica TaxID=4628 RepID=A0AAQ3KAX5_9LILI|nr:ATP-dependent DNA helicase [Canna indica]
MQYSRGKSALVFCSTRKGAVESAQCLSQAALKLGYSNPFIKSIQQQEKLKEASFSFTDKQMQSCIVYGVGYHNGGLCMKDRNLVEGLFLKGDLQVLCTTNTLAHGINLPAHTVVVKSTQFFNKEKGLYMEYERSMVLQMCGRAGRPPFDDTGIVIIMTRRDTVHLYESLLNGCEMVESQLLSCAMEHLMAEIVQLTISDISLAIEWLKCSYLYVRIKRNPENYGIKRGLSQECLEKHMLEICVEKIKELSENGMIWTDEDGFILKPLEPGRLMTKFYLKFNTMKLIVKAPENCSIEDVLHIISHSDELSWIQLRRNEKKLLNDINSDKEGRLRFHVLTENGKRKKRIQTREEKIFVLSNDCLTGDPLVHDLSLNQDINSICMSGCRIAKCMKEFFIYGKNYKGTISSTLLAKCLHHKLWENSPYLLKQLPGIGMVTAKALHSAGINSFESMAAADPRKIEIITGRKYPFGNHIKESLLLLPPKIEIKIEETECRRPGKLKLIVTLHRALQSATSTRYHYADIVCSADNILVYSPYAVNVLVSCPQNARLTIRADLIFEDYVGLDIHEKLIVTKGTNCITTTKGKLNEDAAAMSSYSLPKEIYVVEHDRRSSSRLMSNETQDLNNLEKIQSSMPSFDLLQEGTDGDILILEPQETECKTKSEDIIFDHIRKKSKTFPTSLTSTLMDYSCQPLILRKDNAFEKQGFKIETDLNNIIVIDCEPTETSYQLKEDVSKKQGIEIDADSNDIVLIDSDPTEAIVKKLKEDTFNKQGSKVEADLSDIILMESEISGAISFPMEVNRAFPKSPGIFSSILKPELPQQFGTTYYQPGCRKPCYKGCNDSLKQVQSFGCKKFSSNDTNPASDISQHQPSLLGNQREESFLGFKSVFSFLH